MPEPVTPRVLAGLFGKLPARADFVRAGLPRDFVDRWDGWLSSAMAATREHLGDAWLAAFLQAPMWYFSLPPGLCGAGAVLGLVLPSVDRAGRYFPLTMAAVGWPGSFAIDDAAEAWLARCAEAGFAALEHDAAPEDILASISAPPLPAAVDADRDCLWWTDGRDDPPGSRLSLKALPDAALFAQMIAGFVASAPND